MPGENSEDPPCCIVRPLVPLLSPFVMSGGVVAYAKAVSSNKNFPLSLKIIKG